MRHGRRGLDNGTHFVAGWSHLCLVYLTKVAEPEPAASNDRVSSLHAHNTSFAQLEDDRTATGACGADDVAIPARSSENVFQMIADTEGSNPASFQFSSAFLGSYFSYLRVWQFAP
jgi:hypothetical protein